MKKIILLIPILFLASSCQTSKSAIELIELQENANCGTPECLQKVCEKYGGVWATEITAGEFNFKKCFK